MSENPYQSPAVVSAGAIAQRPAPSLIPVITLFARHAIFLMGLGIALVVCNQLLTNYFTTAGIKLSAPTLLVLKIAQSLVQHWPTALLVAPFYLVFLAIVDAADQRISGIRIAWGFIFWTLYALVLAGLTFGIALPFL